MRLLTTALLLAAAFCVPFWFWGGDFARWFSSDGAAAWIRAQGAWGGLAVLALLLSDLVLPIPATPVMAAAGYLYGPLLGGLLSAAGSFCAGLAGYGLCRAFGQKLARRLVGDAPLARQQTRFERSGPWLVAASRWLPVLPEVVACLAGLTRMPLRTFAVALACGSLPLGLVHAAIGASGHERPRLALALSIFLPLILWMLAAPLLRRPRETPNEKRRTRGWRMRR